MWRLHSPFWVRISVDPELDLILAPWPLPRSHNFDLQSVGAQTAAAGGGGVISKLVF